MSQVAIVTGAGRGIGKVIADHLEENGYEVVRWSRTGGERCLPLDVRDRLWVREYLNADSRLKGGIDLLVNNAGIIPRVEFEQITDDQWDEVMEVNLKGPFIVTQECWPALKRSRGSVVNISTLAALWGSPWMAHYAVSKGGLITLTKCLARVGAPHGIRVNAIAPGLTEGDQTDPSILSAKQVQDILDKTLLGKLTQPQDVAEAVLYLARSKIVTGQVLGLHGGAVL